MSLEQIARRIAEQNRQSRQQQTEQMARLTSALLSNNPEEWTEAVNDVVETGHGGLLQEDGKSESIDGDAGNRDDTGQPGGTAEES